MKRTSLVLHAALVTVLAATGCGSDDDVPTRSSDLATLSGACEALLGEDGESGLVSALVAVHEEALEERQIVQEDLFAIVVDGPEELRDPAGELVDVLDDPGLYFEDGQHDADVQAAFDRIDGVCEGV